MYNRPTSQQAARNSRNLTHLRQVQINGAARSNDNVLAALRSASNLAAKPALPAELLATILDYLPVPDLIRFGQASQRMQEMVYDDTRWVQKLKMMGIWNDGEARQRADDMMKKKVESQKAMATDAAQRTRGDLSEGPVASAATSRKHAGSITLFDASAEESKYRRSIEQASPQTHKRRSTLSEGFDDLTLSASSGSAVKKRTWDPKTALTVMSRARSIRGYARQEFAKIYAALNPLYNDLSRSKGHADAMIFRTYREPEQQAQALSSLKTFAKCDTATGWEQRLQRLESIINVFEHAVLREFEQGLAANDIDGRMRRYAHVLLTIGGGSVCVDTYISSLPILANGARMSNPLDCLDGVAHGHVDLNPSGRFFENLARLAIEQADIIDRVFPPSVDVLAPLLSRLCEDAVSEYLTVLFDDAHVLGVETYVKAISGTFEQALSFVASLKPAKASPTDLVQKAKHMVTRCYERHVDLYLSEELALFRSKAKALLDEWDHALSEQETSTESFFMSNINRQAAKRDFLSSFRKVVMMPVNVLPVMAAPFGAARPATAGKVPPNLDSVDTSYGGVRNRASTLTGSATNSPFRPGTPSHQAEAPTNELAAKAAIMNSRLEGIKSLFSIEVALNLTHTAKASIERAAAMVQMGNRDGENAKTQCGNIFVALVDHLGDRHVRVGFDKAVNHLGDYNPRQVREFRKQAIQGDGIADAQAVGVEPLVTFLELVNVGDLIQQMIDVFYAQELVATNLIDRDDFLDPAVKEKKKFEQMLDERVAAGLNKGIDVLMDEVEFICATTQTAADFNPGAAGPSGAAMVVDIGPSATAKQVVDMVGSHTGMLVGSTDKNMLDVFTQEVGLRLFGVLCKHFKRQRVSVDGAIKLICDINHYSAFVATLRQKPLQPYFQALRELSQIYLVHIDPPTNLFTTNSTGKRGSLLSSRGSKTAAQAKELATIIADTQRYHGVLGAEEVYEFAQRRADWYLVRGDVEKAMYGVGCSLM